MTKLLVSGDSWTSCWPLEERLGHRRLGWPSLVSEYFDFELIDKSRAGSSNYRIYRKAVNGILQEVDLVLVFLTSWTRFESGAVFGPKPGQIYQHIPGHIESDQAFKLFFNGYKTYYDMLTQIISLQSLSVTKNVPCFLLDTFSDNLYRDISINEFKDILKFNIAVFDNLDDERIEDKFKTIKMLESNVDWTKFIAAESYQSIIQDCVIDSGHPIQDGHAKIANTVINFLESMKYGKTI
jgi:hypothetical protein